MKPYKSSLDTFTCSINWVCFLSDRLRERKTRAIWIFGTPRKVPYHCWRKTPSSVVSSRIGKMAKIFFFVEAPLSLDYELTLMNLWRELSLSRILLQCGMRSMFTTHDSSSGLLPVSWWEGVPQPATGTCHKLFFRTSIMYRYHHCYFTSFVFIRLHLVWFVLSPIRGAVSEDLRILTLTDIVIIITFNKPDF